MDHQNEVLLIIIYKINHQIITWYRPNHLINLWDKIFLLGLIYYSINFYIESCLQNSCVFLQTCLRLITSFTAIQFWLLYLFFVDVFGFQTLFLQTRVFFGIYLFFWLITLSHYLITSISVLIILRKLIAQMHNSSRDCNGGICKGKECGKTRPNQLFSSIILFYFCTNFLQLLSPSNGMMTSKLKTI
jgi:hypothetical protein